MCIAKSVGRGGTNKSDDVKSIQICLNLNIYQLSPFSPVTENGKCDEATIAAVERFQRIVRLAARPDGKVDPNGGTLAALRAGLLPGLTEKKLQGIYIHAGTEKIARYFPGLLIKMNENSIDVPLRRVHFLAQIGHESKELIYSEEIASGRAYEGRLDLGNTQPGDGVRFKGRGLIQIKAARIMRIMVVREDAISTAASLPHNRLQMIRRWLWTHRVGFGASTI